MVMEPSSLATVAEGEVAIQGMSAARDPAAAAAANGGRRESEDEEDLRGVFVQGGGMETGPRGSSEISGLQQGGDDKFSIFTSS